MFKSFLGTEKSILDCPLTPYSCTSYYAGIISSLRILKSDDLDKNNLNFHFREWSLLSLICRQQTILWDPDTIFIYVIYQITWLEQSSFKINIQNMFCNKYIYILHKTYHVISCFNS